MFVALVAGSSLRTQFAASTLPEPAAWSGATPPVGAHVLPHRRYAAVSRSAPANKTDKKPFHSMWMTKERPLTWNRLSPQSTLSSAPMTFSPVRVAPHDAQSRAPATIPADRDILTRFCIARV